MDVFLTGATGYIGQAVAGELLSGGHQVTALVRAASTGSPRLRQLGVRIVTGDIADPATYAAEAAAHQALVHMAFDYQGAPGADATAIATLIGALRPASGSAPASSGQRALIYTSGVWVLGATGDTPVDENTAADHPFEMVAWRVGHEQKVLAAGGPGVAAAVIRPGIVYGGSGGIPGRYFETAVGEGAALYIGDGGNRLPMIHVADLARYYRQVVERGGRGVFHAVDGNAVPVAEVARSASEAAGKGGAIRSLPLDQARQKLGPFADALALDQVVETRRAAELGWRPDHPNFASAAARAYQEWKAAQAT